jgi:hypothetical protein
VPATIVFKDRPSPWQRADIAGFNRTGYVTREGIVIYPRRSRIARAPLNEITRKPHALIDLSKHPRAEQIEQFFTQNVINKTAYVTAIEKIGDVTSPFWDHPIKIPILKPLAAKEREAIWTNTLSILQPGDNISTFDTRSTISRVITYFDQGTWSHTATYVGDGRVIEAVSQGVIERSIDVYKDPRYRLGVYRAPGITQQQIDKMIAFVRSHLGDRYGYRRVLILGIRMALGMQRTGPPTPNELIIAAGFDLVGIV